MNLNLFFIFIYAAGTNGDLKKKDSPKKRILIQDNNQLMYYIVATVVHNVYYNERSYFSVH